MKLASSNIALTTYDHIAQLKPLADMGISGIEIAPSRVWRDTWKGLKASDVSAYRRAIETAGLDVVGLHSLFYDQPDLRLFGDSDTRARTLGFMEHLSKLCRDLDGKTLIYGGGRNRGDLPLEDAFSQSEMFFHDLIPRIENHGTVFCFEPLGSADSDFINSVYDSVRLVESVDHPSLRVQLDAKALVATGELTKEVFEAAAPYLVHVHANEPDFGVLGTSGTVDHQKMSGLLNDIGYTGYVSIEQKMIGEDDPLAAISQSAKILEEYYS
jgi:sugar phosphate isomerase/epimerase